LGSVDYIESALERTDELPQSHTLAVTSKAMDSLLGNLPLLKCILQATLKA
jgi:hypothetical protein